MPEARLPLFVERDELAVCDRGTPGEQINERRQDVRRALREIVASP
jgi:hypothetical protein